MLSARLARFYPDFIEGERPGLQLYVYLRIRVFNFN